jgi:hypothetical protein
MNLPATYNPPAQPPAVNKAVNYTAGVNPLSPEGGKLIDTLARSSIIPKEFRSKPDAILVVWLLGARVGLDVFASMQFICEINGKPTIYGDGALAVAYQNPRLKSLVEEYVENDQLGTIARCIIHVKTQDQPFVEEFAMANAKAAGLLNKQGPWTQYPRRMLRMRARAYALRAAFPDSLAGFHLAEEMIGAMTVEHEVIDSTIAAVPTRAVTKGKVDDKVAEAKALIDGRVMATGEVIHQGKDSVITGGVILPELEPAKPAAVAENPFDDAPAKPTGPTREQLVARARAIHEGGDAALLPQLLERYKVKRLSLIAADDIPRAWVFIDGYEDREPSIHGVTP